MDVDLCDVLQEHRCMDSKTAVVPLFDEHHQRLHQVRGVCCFHQRLRRRMVKRGPYRAGGGGKGSTEGGAGCCQGRVLG